MATIISRKSAVIVGCGSVGAPMALALAQAGIGKLILVDHDTLSWANTARHPLGAANVDDGKAAALAARLRRDFPHIEVEAITSTFHQALTTHPALFEDADLVVSATGSWAVDAELDALRAATPQPVAVLAAWTEAYACAGHAVLVAGEDSLRAGFDETGLPLCQVVDWQGRSTEQQEPACGTSFQPYGAVELAFVTAMASELALEAIVNDTPRSAHRIWSASQRKVKALGGVWSAEWVAIVGPSHSGGQITERPWPSAPKVSMFQAA